MTEFRELTDNQQWLFWELRNEILSKKGIAGILARYKSENQDSYAEDIEAVLTALQEGDLGKNYVSEEYTLAALAVQAYNVEALKDILNVVEKIDGLKKKIPTEVQFKGFDGKGYTLINYAKSCIESDYKDPDQEKEAKEIVKIINNMIQAPEEQQNQDAGPGDSVINNPKSSSFLSQRNRGV